MVPLRLLFGVAVLAGGCATLPPLDARTPSSSLAPDPATALARAVAPLAAAHPGKTGIHALPSPTDAFAARVLLAQAAQRSLDAQYYIWHADETGLMLLEELVQAGARGVRVRLLLDDQNTKGLHPLLAAVSAQPNVEVRLYNPFAHGARIVDYLVDFSRVNRRMHNKAFIADGHAAVVGGRNIGNEYFGAGDEVPFKDLDVIAVGAALPAVSAQFDLYWNSASAYPVALLGEAAPADAASWLAARLAESRAREVSRLYREAVRATPLLGQLLEGRLPWVWAEARLVHDDPAKTLDTAERTDVLLLASLMDGQVRPRASLDIISPYFVPGERGTELLEGLARGGVRVRVLTNSLAATDVGVVHSGYAKRRCRLARAGVRLYELKASASAEARADRPESVSSKASLHAKTFAADRARLFVGSFNFDPRSALLNTEMGLVIASPELAGVLATAFDERIPPQAYEVRAREGGSCIEWIERAAGGERVHHTEPATSWGRRAWVGFLTLMPLDWLL